MSFYAFNISKILNRNLIASYSSQISRLLYSFLIIFLFGQYGSNFEYGVYIFAYSLLTIISDILGQNSIDTTLYFIRTLKSSTASCLRTSAVWDNIFGLFIFIVVYFLGRFSNLFLEYHLEYIALLISLKIWITNFRNFIFVELIHSNKYHIVYIFRTLENLILSIYLLFYFVPEVEFMVTLETITAAIISVLILLYFIFLRKKHVNESGQKADKIKFIKHAYKLFLVRSVKISSRKLDNVFLGIYVSPDFLGIYDKLKKLVLPIDILTNPFREIYYPKILDFKNKNDVRGLTSFIYSKSKHLMILMLPTIIILVAIKDLWFDFSDISGTKLVNFAFFALITQISLNGLLWWVKSFSNAWNPFYSLYANLIALLVLLTGSYFTLHFGENAFLLGIFSIGWLLTIYWFALLYNYFKKDVS